MSLESNVGVLEILGLPISDFVEAAYRILLERTPDPVELRARAGELRIGMGRQRLLAEIVASSEYQERITNALGELDDRAFIARLYRLYLGRSPDPAGLAHYLKLLGAGGARERLERNIAASAEARVASTFWRELHLIIEEERRASRGFASWVMRLGFIKRSERRLNRQAEIWNGSRLRHGTAAPEFAPSSGERADQSEAESLRTATSLSTGRAPGVGVAPPLGAHAIRVLNKLRNVAAAGGERIGKQDAPRY